MIAEEFGANATYVQGLLERFRSNPNLVDESWRTYFAELDGDSSQPQIPENGKQAAAPVIAEPVKSPAIATAVKPAVSVTPRDGSEALPIRGAALKIVENMEASLAVPTATSQRRVPVKLLDENRLIINRYLGANH